jgi:hypothetical protein
MVSVLILTLNFYVQKSVQIRTEAGSRLHIEPPLDCSEDFESQEDVIGKHEDATGEHTQVGAGLSLYWGLSQSQGLLL